MVAIVGSHAAGTRFRVAFHLFSSAEFVFASGCPRMLIALCHIILKRVSPQHTPRRYTTSIAAFGHFAEMFIAEATRITRRRLQGAHRLPGAVCGWVGREVGASHSC